MGSAPITRLSDKPSIRAQWCYLRAAVDKLQKELVEVTGPRPSARMCKFLVLGEDRRFAIHPGVDPVALCRALWKTYLCSRRQGGSTIAMQTVRTIVGQYERSFARKATEMILAICLSRYVAKERIPVLYLWCAYYGWRMNNFPQACRRLGIDPLSASEADEAELVARIKYPQPRRQDVVRMGKIRRRGRHLIDLSHSYRAPYNAYRGGSR